MVDLPLAKRLALALDTPDLDSALDLVRRTRGAVGTYKVGLELFTAVGPAILTALAKEDVDVFLDLKLHDIPTTVERALRRLLELDPRLINVHAQGGPAMLEAAARVVREHRQGGGRTELLAVTVLTSLDREALARTGQSADPEDLALHLAHLSQACGCDGVVCSAREAAAIRAACGADFRLLTPGIRPKGQDAQDQARVMDPASALAAGATWLVVGRPITHAPDPAAAADALLRELTGAL